MALQEASVPAADSLRRALRPWSHQRGTGMLDPEICAEAVELVGPRDGKIVKAKQVINSLAMHIRNRPVDAALRLSTHHAALKSPIAGCCNATMDAIP